jgi:hypothetical protein
MNILIVSESGSGKSNLGDIIRNGIFKADKNSIIKTNDMGREVKSFGNGKNVYNLSIRKLEGQEMMSIDGIDLSKYDIVVLLKGGEFKKTYDKLHA